MKEKQQIAMIGGSFNPVTKAHVEMGRIAAKELGTDWEVLYVPAPDRFLTSWKEMKPQDILSGEQRLGLLRRAVEPEGFFCEDCEVYGRTSGRTYDTIRYLKERRGEDTAFLYVCGTDKLPELQRWYRADDLFDMAGILVISRDGDDPKQLIQSSPFLMKRKDRILISQEPRRYPDYSATKVRESIKAGDMRWKDMVPETVQDELERMVAAWH